MARALPRDGPPLISSLTDALQGRRWCDLEGEMAWGIPAALVVDDSDVGPVQLAGGERDFCPTVLPLGSRGREGQKCIVGCFYSEYRQSCCCCAVSVCQLLLTRCSDTRERLL